MTIETSASQSVMKIASAIHAVMQDVPYVQKTGRNEFHRYSYASEADLLEKLRPALIKHGLVLIPSTRSVGALDQWGNVNVIVEYTLVHKDGDIWPTTIKAPGCGNDRTKDGRVGDKGIYKALTGANKYLLYKLFQIETGDDPEQDAVHEQQPSLKQSPKMQPAPQGPSKEVYISKAIQRMNDMESAPRLLEWATRERKMVWAQYGIDPHDEDGQRLVASYKERMAVLEQAAKTETVE